MLPPALWKCGWEGCVRILGSLLEQRTSGVGQTHDVQECDCTTHPMHLQAGELPAQPGPGELGRSAQRAQVHVASGP